MAKIKDIRKWGFFPGSANESGDNPFLPILKRMLSSIGVGYKDPCCPNEKACQDPCGYIQTLSTDDMTTISISGLDGAPGNTIDLKALVDYSETVTVFGQPTLVADADGRLNVLQFTYTDEDGVTHTKQLDLGDLLPDLMIQSGSYDASNNTVTLVTYDGSTITFTINELTTITNTLTKANKQRIGTFKDENEQLTDFYESVTSLSFDGSNLNFVNEDGSQSPVDITGLAADCCIASVSGINAATGEVTFTRNDGSTFNVAVDALTSVSFNGSNLTYVDEKGVSNVLDLTGIIADCCIASASYIQANGEVIFTKNDGSILTVKTESLTSITTSGTNLLYTDEKGTANTINLTSVVQAAETNISVSDTNAAASKKEIATVTNEDGTVYSIKESVTSFSASADTATGILTLTFVDENGTSNVSTIDFCSIISACVTPLSIVTDSVVDQSVVGVGDGCINTTASGGVLPLTYSIDGVNFVSGEDFCSQYPGTYTITVKDSVGSTATTSGTIKPAVGINIDSITNETAPGESDGCIYTSSVQGTAPFEYSIDGGTTWQSTGSFCGLPAGNYTVTIKDANNKTASVPAVINAGVVALSVSTTTIVHEGLANANDGSITVQGAGGVAPYEYSIDGGVTWQSSNVFSGLADGAYTILVKDSTGATASTVGTVLPGLSLTTTNVTNETDPSANDGTVTVQEAGGVGPYQYSIDGVNYQSSPNFTGVAAGSYTMYVKDSRGVIATSSAVVTETLVPPVVVVNSTTDIYTYSGTESTFTPGTDGTATLAGSSGTGNYEYSIDGGVTWQSSATFTGLAAGVYPSKIKDTVTGLTSDGPSFEIYGLAEVIGYQAQGEYWDNVDGNGAPSCGWQVDLFQYVEFTKPVVTGDWVNTNGFISTFGDPWDNGATDGNGDKFTPRIVRAGKPVRVYSVVSDMKDPLGNWSYCGKTYQGYQKVNGVEIVQGNLVQATTECACGSGSGSECADCTTSGAGSVKHLYAYTPINGQSDKFEVWLRNITNLV